jgi:hypothetical protein
LDGGPLPALTKDDARRFEGAWNREVERAFNLTREQARGLERGPGQDRISALDPSARHLQQEWSRASARLFAVYTDRLAGKATQKDLADAAGQARAARVAWSREVGPSVNLRDLDSRQVFDVVRLRIEGGSRYFRGPLEAERRPLLETAASRAAGLPDEANRRVAVVAWPAGRDLHATVYFNQRSQSDRPPGSIEPERLRAALEVRLPDEIRRLAPSLDPTAGARADELGRIEARIQDRTPPAERVVPGPERPDTPASLRTPALLVTLDRDTESSSRTAAHAGDDRLEGLSRLQTPERDWGNERVLSVRLEIPTGVEQLARMGLSPEEAKHVIQRAVDRAYPFLQQEGIRDNFLSSARGKALDVQIVVPEKLGWTRDQLRSPQFQQRFIAGFHHAAAQVVLTRTGPALEPTLPGLARGVSAVRQAPQVIRQFEQDPERAAKDLVRAAFNKLSEALPKPFRVMQELGRTVSRFRSRGE